MRVKKGTTSVSVYFMLRSSADGTAKTGLVYNSAGAVASYTRSRGLRTAITLATLAAADSAWSAGGFKEVDGVNEKGLYRLDVPNASVIAGVDEVFFHLSFTGVFAEVLRVTLTDNTEKDIYDRVGAPTLGSVSEDVAFLQNTVDNLGFSQRLQSTLTDIIQAPLGDNYIQILVLIVDSNDSLFDPADITDPGIGPRNYNGVGAVFSDISGGRVVMFKDALGTPLDSMGLCHHTGQPNGPQLLVRQSTGIYAFWINATATGDALPLGQLNAIFGFFDIAQIDATYGPSFINDTVPSSHKRIINSVGVLAPAVPDPGNNQITVHVQDGGALPIPDVFVRIADASGVITLGTGYTNASGDVVFALDDGDYQVILRKALVNFTVPELLTVTVDATVDYTGDVLVPSAPVQPNTCVVYGVVIDNGGNVVAGAEVYIQELDRATFAGTEKIVKSVETVSDANGYWELEVIRTSELTPSNAYRAIIIYRALKYEVDIIVPDQNSVEFSTLT